MSGLVNKGGPAVSYIDNLNSDTILESVKQL